MGTDQSTTELTLDGAQLLRYVRLSVYFLVVVLALSLLTVGTIAILAELKGTWHWQIHLQSTISYMGLFVSRLLLVLVPLFLVLVVGRQVVDDA
jgi:flagellar biosynthesis protein FlhB